MKHSDRMLVDQMKRLERRREKCGQTFDCTSLFVDILLSFFLVQIETSKAYLKRNIHFIEYLLMDRSKTIYQLQHVQVTISCPERQKYTFELQIECC